MFQNQLDFEMRKEALTSAMLHHRDMDYDPEMILDTARLFYAFLSNAPDLSDDSVSFTDLEQYRETALGVSEISR